MSDGTTTGLARVLGLRDVILIVIGTVIGSGIFIVPGAVLRQTGGPGPAVFVWLVGGVLSLLGALTYGELAARNPQAGGLYVYIRDAFGELPAFLFGWTLFFVVTSGSVATLAVAFASYCQTIIPLGPLAAKAMAVAMIAVVAAVNVRGTRHSASVQGWSTAIKVAAILVMGVALTATGTGLSEPGVFQAPAVTSSTFSGMGLAVLGTLWAYEGWQYATYSAGEVRDAQRVFPRGIIIGTSVLVGIYVFANVAYVAALGPDRAAGTDAIAAYAVGEAFGPSAARLVAATILVSIFSAANGLTLTGSRVYYAWGRDGLFFRRLADLHPRFGTPTVAIVSSSAWAMLLTVTGTFEQLLTYVIFTAWIFYALGALSVFSYRRRGPDVEGGFRVPFYPWTPLLFVAAAAAIVVNTLATTPSRALLGLAIVALGLPAYLVWHRKR